MNNVTGTLVEGDLISVKPYPLFYKAVLKIGNIKRSR